jgi:hypothetical protein
MEYLMFPRLVSRLKIPPFCVTPNSPDSQILFGCGAATPWPCCDLPAGAV